jgi:hypothetical protein
VFFLRYYYPVILLIVALVLISGSAAESLGSYKYTVGPNFLPSVDNTTTIGSVVVPAGLGLLTETEILNPYPNLNSEGQWHPLPEVVDLVPANQNDSHPDLRGMSIYQNGVEVRGISFTSGIPLKVVSRSITNYSEPTTLDVMVKENSIIKDVKNDYSLEYSVDFNSFNVNLSQYKPINITGNWTTDMGLVNLTTGEIKFYKTTTVSGNFSDGKRMSGVLNGPVWSGDWESNTTLTGGNSEAFQGGKFLVVFDPSWTSFNGTKGLLNSETNEGVFSGKKAGI